MGNQIELDTNSWTESTSIPKNISLNHSWTSEDGAWQHQIYSKHERFVTPAKTYEDCLVIQAIQLKNRDKKN